MNDILLYFAVKYAGDFELIFNAIMNKELCDDQEIKNMINKIKCPYTTVISSDYPKKLKNLNCPPFVLFYKGDLNLINEKTIGVIGSRYNSKFGNYYTNNLVKDLVENKYVIVSGLAKGIDSLSHRACLENGGKTIAVLGNGLDNYYPFQNQELQDEIMNVGLVVSEYPPFVKPNKDFFPRRNRIIAAISDSLIVIEAKKNSGTMITVNEALNLGKDIMCVPSRPLENSGCNYLIKNGAYLIEDINDVLEIMNDK